MNKPQHSLLKALPLQKNSLQAPVFIMKKIIFFLFVFSLASCGSSKNTTKTIVVNEKGTPNRIKTVEKRKNKEKLVITTTEADEVITKDSNKDILENVIEHAFTFEGTRYKFGGTTKEGMDCSGLVFTAFHHENVILPRISRDMAKKGTAVTLPEVTKGDLVFFITGSKKKTINHVGIVVEVKPKEILFIHTSTSQGVIISSLEENYWKNAFVEARRII